MLERDSQPMPTPPKASPASARPDSAPVSKAMQSPEPPQIPDHELLRCIGRGSYGEVWLARNVMGTYRAVKIVYRATFDSDRPYEREFAGIQRFEPISRSHESQVDILHIGRNDQEAQFYYVMELADDQNNGQQIDPERYKPKTLRSEIKQKGRLPSEECLQIGSSISTALEHLHKHDLIHRDIKPSNIIFVNGIPKLADIGLVASSDATCSFVGTEGYLPPEGPGSRQADLYSLGKVLYEIATGKDRREFPEWPSALDNDEDEKNFRELNALILKLCKPEAKARYQTAQQLHADLLLLQAGKSVRRTHTMERRLKLAIRAILGTAALLVLTAGAYFGAIRQAHRAEVAEANTREALREAYLNQARANRWSGRAGRRFEGLEALKKAAEIRPGVDLRNEAIACMTLMDLRMGQEFSPTLKNLAIDHQFDRFVDCDASGTMTIRRVSDSQELLRLPGPGAPGWELELSCDGNLLAAHFHPGTIYSNTLLVWNLPRREVLLRLTNALGRHSISADERQLAVFLKDYGLALYDLDTIRETRRFDLKLSTPALRFSPDGRRLAVAAVSDTKVRIVDLNDTEKTLLLEHGAGVRRMDWHPNGKWLAAPCDDRHIYLWDTTTGQKLAMLKGHQAEPVEVQFSPNGNLLASRGWDGTVRLWDLQRSEQILSLNAMKPVLRFSPDERYLGTAQKDAKMVLLELDTARECRTLKSYGARPISKTHMNSTHISADGRLLAVGDDGVRIWDLASERELAFLNAGRVSTVHFHHTGLLTSGPDGLLLWPMEQADSSTIHIGPSRRLAEGGNYGQMQLSKDGHRLAVARDPVHVLVFDLDTTNPPVKLGGLPNLRGAALSPDGGWAASGTWLGNDVRVWAADTGKPVADLRIEGSTEVVFSPDGQWLITTTGKECQFWRVGTWQLSHRIQRDNSSNLPTRPVFSADGRIMALSCNPSQLQLICPSNASVLASLDLPHSYPLCFNADGTTFITGNKESMLQVWDMHLIRQQLAAMRLDWEMPPLPLPRKFEGRLEIVVMKNEKGLGVLSSENVR